MTPAPMASAKQMMTMGVALLLALELSCASGLSGGAVPDSPDDENIVGVTGNVCVVLSRVPDPLSVCSAVSGTSLVEGTMLVVRADAVRRTVVTGTVVGCVGLGAIVVESLVTGTFVGLATNVASVVLVSVDAGVDVDIDNTVVMRVGGSVGDNVGVSVGDNVGDAVDRVGVSVGDWVGVDVLGEALGASVGEMVGAELVGADVGVQVLHSHSVAPAVYMSSRHSQSLNASSPINVTPSGIMIVQRLLHSMKASSPMEITDIGIITESRTEQSLKTFPGRRVTESGKNTEASAVHDSNADVPISSTLSDRDIMVRA